MVSRSMAPTVGKLLVVALAYFVTGWLGLQIPYAGSQITLVWLPTGIAVSALLRWGRGMIPGIYLGAFCVNLAIGPSWLLAGSIAVGNTLGPMLAALLLRRAGFHIAFDRQRDIRLFVGASAFGMIIPSALGVSWLHVAGILPATAMPSAWLAWWMGDTLGVMLAAPLLLTLNRYHLRQLGAAKGQLLLWLAAATPLGWLAFFHDLGPEVGRTLPLAFLTLPLLTWASLRFGTTGGTLAVLYFAVTASVSTALGHGFVVHESQHIGLFMLWLYITTIALTELMISSIQARRVQAEATLRESEQKLRGLFDLFPLGIAMTDMTGRYLEFNEAFRSLCGYSNDELKKLDYWALTPEKYAADEARQIESLHKTGRYGPYQKEYVRKDGSMIDLLLKGMLIRRGDGEEYVWSVVEDITDRQRVESSLRVAAAAFEAQVGIMVTDAEMNILRVNRAFSEDSGYSAEEVVGRKPSMFKSGRHDAAFYTAMWDSIQRTGVWQGEIWDRRKNGELYPKWMTITAVKGDDGQTTHYVSTQIDTTENKAAEDEIRTLAFYDPLTSLPNRRLLLDRLQQAMAQSMRSGQIGALLFIDLDHFKTLNDTLGHDKGDQLLQQVAQRLSGSVRVSDTVARLGGDEFVVMLEGLSENMGDAAAQARQVGEKILASFSQPFQLDGYEQFSTPSVGIALFQGDHDQLGDLLKRADLAMYQAKASGRNAIRFFDPAMQAVVNERVALEADLRHALAHQEFIVNYQPQVDADGRMTGAEALVRWRHPRRGMVPPSDFIPLAEDTGQILPLGQWVLEAACQQLAVWSQSPVTRFLDLAVNISARQFYHPEFVDQVLAVLDRTGANPHLLKLELTESLLLNNIDDTIVKMTRLKTTGIRFSLDDFGTGYSSLAYLKRLPLDQLKIDQSFVRDILTDSNDAAIARTIVTLGNSLGLSVIAEGVETEEQLTFLAVHGCMAYQGYLFSKPLSAAELESFVAHNC